jgi:hypothetical protein
MIQFIDFIGLEAGVKEIEHRVSIIAQKGKRVA